MKYLYTIVFMLCAVGASAQRPQSVSGRVASEDGRFEIESFTISPVGDSLRVEIGELRLLNPNSPTAQLFSVPAVFAVPFYQNRGRQVDPSDYAGQMRITVIDLSEQEDELFMDIEIRMNGDVMNRRLSYLLIPELVGGDNSVTGAGFLVNGWGKDQLYRRRMKFGNTALLENLPDLKVAVVNYTDSLVRYKLRMPYEPWMDDASLNIHQVVGSPAGKEQLYTLAGVGRVALQSREPYKVLPAYSFITPEPEQKSRRMQGQAFLDFAVGRSVIVPTYRRNPEELAKIEAAIRKVQDDPDVTINGLYIEGYASPEGSYITNERLARERSQALANYISKNYGVPASMIGTSYVAEDWDGLRLLVEGSNLARKAEVLEYIDSDLHPDQKEARLKALGLPWTTMSNTMFPQLRRVEYQIDFTVKDYSLITARDILNTNPELLSQREMFLIAIADGTGTPEWEQILETIIRLYPDDPTAIINYSGLLLMRGELASAKRYLDRVADNPDAANHLGIYYLLSGDLENAEIYFRKAQGQGQGTTEAARNLEELELKREDNIRMARYRK